MQKPCDNNRHILKEDTYYRERIVEMVQKIRNPKILYCIYIFVSDIMIEDIETVSDVAKEDTNNEQIIQN